MNIGYCIADCSFLYFSVFFRYFPTCFSLLPKYRKRNAPILIALLLYFTLYMLFMPQFLIAQALRFMIYSPTCFSLLAKYRKLNPWVYSLWLPGTLVIEPMLSALIQCFHSIYDLYTSIFDSTSCLMVRSYKIAGFFNIRQLFWAQLLQLWIFTDDWSSFYKGTWMQWGISIELIKFWWCLQCSLAWYIFLYLAMLDINPGWSCIKTFVYTYLYLNQN